MKITKYSQLTFVVESDNGYRILIDPGKYNFDSDFKPEDFGRVDLMIITHKHGDHHDLPAERIIIEKHSPVVITNEEIGSWEEEKSLGFHTRRVGDNDKFGDFNITYIYTDHFAKGEHVINLGLFFQADNKSYYHTSDTRFMEMGMYDFDLVKGCDVLSVPISNRGVVMGIDDSIVFTSQIRPGVVIPGHYDSPKDKVRVSPKDFVERFDILKKRIESLSEISVKVLNFAETIII